MVSSAIAATFCNDLLAGKVALVVGGTSGIGAAIAGALAQAGAVVTVTGATRAEIDAARAVPDFAGRDAIALDVRDDAAVRHLLDDLPRLDVLVNAAGIIRRDDEHAIDVFDEVLSINLRKSCILSSKESGPHGIAFSVNDQGTIGCRNLC